jgi:hypothetical protein
MPDHFTTRLQLPYPDIDDPADVPADLQQLASRLDAVVGGVTLSSPVSEVGQVNQCRAGRQLAASDFTALGLSAPRGLWNLSDLTDASGNGRALANKGAVTFAAGINGAAATAAQFTGSTAQALYIADTGAADPFRIVTGSWSCWFRTAKRGTTQRLLTKISTAAGNYAWGLAINGASNVTSADVFTDGSTGGSAQGVSDVCDDRWHFGVAAHDGTTCRLYVDGVLEGIANVGPIFAGSAPLNIGARSADSGAAAVEPFYGRVDEAFVTADVLTEDQIRSLYAARIAHTLGAQPKSVSLSVRRQRRGAALATADFSTGPLRLYNFDNSVNGGLNDQGSNAANLTYNSGVGGPGADGRSLQSISYPGAGGGLSATDAGLPSGLAARSYGCWFKTAAAATAGIMGWGTTLGSTDVRFYTNVTSGALVCANGADAITGPYIFDGQWHFAVAVEDNVAGDGVRRKFYLDGRLIGGSTVLNSIALGGANRFRVGASIDGSGPFTGQIDAVFVTGYAMPTDEVQRLYNKAAQTMAASPKNAGDHVEGYDSGSVLVVADTLEAQHLIDLTLA